MSPASKPTSVPKTALDVARQRWRSESWGEPRDDAQERLWCLFFTNREPDDPQWYIGWTRPSRLG